MLKMVQTLNSFSCDLVEVENKKFHFEHGDGITNSKLKN